MNILIILLIIIILYLFTIPIREYYSQDYKPEQYASNIIPCSPRIK